MSEPASFDSIVGTEPTEAKGRFHKLRRWFIRHLYKGIVVLEKKEDPEFFISTARDLIANNTQDAFILDTSRKLLVQQRIMDDTKARRRLEKWARNIILCYLIIVFVLVVLNGVSQIIWNDIFKNHGFISDTVMTVILSTTTVNIIGLGVIVLRGHFPSYGNEDGVKSEKISNHSQNKE